MEALYSLTANDDEAACWRESSGTITGLTRSVLLPVECDGYCQLTACFIGSGKAIVLATSSLYRFWRTARFFKVSVLWPVFNFIYN